MVGGVYDSRNFEQTTHNGLKQKYFYPRTISHKMCRNYILLEIFIKNAVLGDFQSKSKSFHLIVVLFCLFWWLGVIYDFQATQ
jgi:hypothetical protein